MREVVSTHADRIAVVEQWSRQSLFDRLHETHAYKFQRGPKDGEARKRFWEWRRVWWREFEKAFPDKIKDGVVICRTSAAFTPLETSQPDMNAS